ncbi:hypothetical protein KZO37_13310 [Rhodococcus fascians]|uniref:hypothetical protein n=1 Tax=Nocardiaceae TaxID=85025 RepID=UPI0019D25716|nr:MULTISPECIES: hypothetical protein [Rhodococcus]MBW4780344.1 hypothetical protein [Rhodococcus fascians]MDJ0005013.1 hypothetical protein [Rhodococcus fascians]
MFTDAELAAWLVAERDYRIAELEHSGLESSELLDELRAQIVDAAITRQLDTAGLKPQKVADLLAALDHTKFVQPDGTVDVGRVEKAIGALARGAVQENRPPPRSSDRAPNRGVGRYFERT